jgi:hypothetical protein
MRLTQGKRLSARHNHLRRDFNFICGRANRSVKSGGRIMAHNKPLVAIAAG